LIAEPPRKESTVRTQFAIVFALITSICLGCEETARVRRPATTAHEMTPETPEPRNAPDPRKLPPTISPDAAAMRSPVVQDAAAVGQRDVVASPDAAADQRGSSAPDAAPAATGVDLFRPVHDAFATFCADCHHGDFSRGPSGTYKHLMGMTEKSVECAPPRPRVKPGDPEGSVIYQKIASDTPSCGNRMPNTCKVALGNCLSTKEIAAVKAWILAGAPPPGK